MHFGISEGMEAVCGWVWIFSGIAHSSRREERDCDFFSGIKST